MAESQSKEAERRARTERGFTFLEVLIATAVFSFSIAALFAVYSNTLVASEVARERTIARLRLQSLIAEIGVTRPLVEGTSRGDYEGGYSWSVDIEPYGTRAERAAAQVSAWEVTARVSWSGRGKPRSLQVSTIRLGGEPPT